MLGFSEVYDYVGGKEDWAAAGWPLEGHVHGPTVAELARKEIPTCAPEDPVRDLPLDGTPPFVLVLNRERVVLGKVVPRHRDESPDATAADVMIEGPTTVRADEQADALLERMRAARTSSVVVTAKEGTLVGVFLAADAEQAMR